MAIYHILMASGCTTHPHLAPLDLPFVPLALIPPPLSLEIVQDLGEGDLRRLSRQLVVLLLLLLLLALHLLSLPLLHLVLLLLLLLMLHPKRRRRVPRQHSGGVYASIRSSHSAYDPLVVAS